MPKATWDDFGGSPWEDELDDFPIYDGELPPKGVYRFVLKRLQLTSNKNNEPMLKGLMIIDEPAGSKKSKYNGKDVWFNLNVTKQGTPWVNNFLSALVPESKVAAVRKAFWSQKVMVDKSEPPTILSIGAVKITENLLIGAQCGHKTYNGDQDLDAKRFLRPSDTSPSGDAGDDPEEGDDDWEESEEETEAEPEAEEPEGDEDDEEYNERAAELEAMDRSGLLKAAKAAGIAVKRGTKEDDIIDDILAAEFPPDDEESDEEEEPEEEEEEPEEEPEPEPEPDPKARRTRAKPAAKAEPAEEPAARAKTGTRRRRAPGEPPF